jgi:hypothetical protein
MIISFDETKKNDFTIKKFNNSIVEGIVVETMTYEKDEIYNFYKGIKIRWNMNSFRSYEYQILYSDQNYSDIIFYETEHDKLVAMLKL